MHKGFKTILCRAIEGDRHQVDLLVKEATAMAEVYLKMQAKRHLHLFQFISDSWECVAMDSVAELFETENGRLMQLELWAERIELDTCKESDLYIHFRRLIGREINDHIFKTYKSKDPSLAKLIRNLKRGISERSIDELQLHNSNLISLISDRETSVLIPIEALQSFFSGKISRIQNSTDALLFLRDLLEKELPEIKLVRLTDFALTIRNLFVLANELEEESVALSFSVIELKKFIEQATNAVQREMYGFYVHGGKMTDAMYAGYFYLVLQILEAEYLSENPYSHYSFYEHFVRFYSDISKSEYKEQHRNTLEYFVKKSRACLVDELRKEWQSVVPVNGEG